MLARRAQLVGTYGLAGIAAWRAGFEPPEAWHAIDAALVATPAVPLPPTETPTAPDPAPAVDEAPAELARPTMPAERADPRLTVPDRQREPASADATHSVAAAATAPLRNARPWILVAATALLLAVGSGHTVLRRRRRD